MNRSRKVFGTLLLCAGSVVAMLVGPVYAQDIDPRIAKVVEDWQKRQQRTNRVRYEVSGEYTIPKGSGTEMLRVLGVNEPDDPPHDINGPIKETMLIDFTTGRYRVELTKQEYHKETDRFYPFMRISVFDGKELKAWRPRGSNTHPIEGVKPGEPEIGVNKGNLSGASFTWAESPFFAGHGSVVTEQAPIMPGKLHTMPNPEILVVHGRAVHDGRVCLVLRTHARRGSVTSFNEYWVDTDRESALIRQLYYLGKTASEEVDIEYQLTDHGWLPKQWKVAERNAGSGSPRYLCNMRVDRLELEPSTQASHFQIEERPGMGVRETTNTSLRPGIPPADKDEWKTFAVDNDGKRKLISTNTTPSNRSKWWYYGGGALAVALFLGCWLRRRQRRLPTA